ncbi:hypothetical protein IAQ61_009117 [Plenodomus lingam]|uniref:uncharacterized protein n=1 Tax=Leptosphaeria maculans TaxID=5022 RepID=UPI00332ADF85|nr:hypothetical protein IAQ61_009117 [Plenodomus lingam]
MKKTVIDNTIQYELQMPQEPSFRSPYAQSPKLHNRFNTLIRKASQLCHMSETEVYMIVRHENNFYVYNKDSNSRVAPEPHEYETVVNVAVTRSETLSERV